MTSYIDISPSDKATGFFMPTLHLEHAYHPDAENI